MTTCLLHNTPPGGGHFLTDADLYTASDPPRIFLPPRN